MMASVVETRAAGLTGPLVQTVDGRAEQRPFADVARDHLDRLYGFCVRLTNDPSDADDLVQETLLRAMRAYDDLRDASRAKGWLFAIATNASRDLFRTRGRQVSTVPFDTIDADGDEFSLFE